MKIIVCKDYEEMSRKAVELVAESLRETPAARIRRSGQCG